MNRFQTLGARILGIKAAPSSPGAGLVIPHSISGRPVERPWTRDQFMRIAATSCETAANCMVFRADGVSKAPFGRIADGEFDSTHPLSVLFSRPNLQYSESDFFHQVMYTLQGDSGGAFIVAPLNNAGVPIELWVRNSRQVRPIPDENTFISGWQIRVNQTWETLDPNAYLVWQHRYVPLDVEDLWGSWAPLLRAQRSVKSFSYLGAWLEALLQNRALLDGFITTKGDAPNENIDAIESRLQGKLEGPANAGGIRFLPGNLDFIDVAQKLSDIDPGSVQDRLETTICGSFQLNPVSVRAHAGMQVAGGLGGDKFSQLIAQDFQGTITSDWNLLKADLIIALSERFGLDANEMGFDTSKVPELDEDEDAKYERVKGAVFLSPNQALKIVGEDESEHPLANLPLAVIQAIARTNPASTGVTPTEETPTVKAVVLPFRPKVNGL